MIVVILAGGLGTRLGEMTETRRMLGQQPLFSLAEGLQRTIAYYRSFLGEV